MTGTRVAVPHGGVNSGGSPFMAVSVANCAPSASTMGAHGNHMMTKIRGFLIVAQSPEA